MSTGRSQLSGNVYRKVVGEPMVSKGRSKVTDAQGSAPLGMKQKQCQKAAFIQASLSRLFLNHCWLSCFPTEKKHHKNSI